MEMRLLFLIALGCALSLQCCSAHVYRGAEVVTYGEPCYKSHEYNYEIEKVEKPVPEPYKNDGCVQNEVRRNYRYHISVPETVTVVPTERQYNFEVEVPRAEEIKREEEEHRCVHYLKGLRSRIDRYLVPACEYPAKKEEQRELEVEPSRICGCFNTASA